MNESVILVTVLILLIIGLAIFGGILYKKILSLTDGNQSQSGNLLLQNQLNSLVNNLDFKLSETNKIIQEQLNLSANRSQQQTVINNDLLRKINENNSKILQELTEKLVKVEDTNKQVVDFAKQLQSLENILKSPKQRGILGEYFLETILSNTLPQSVYKIQYHFDDGVIVDAAIFARDKVIPIDAKFSLEGFNRVTECDDLILRPKYEKLFIEDVKKRIDETSKYVKPNEDTVNIAFMFVPSDGVYQEIIKLGCSQENSIDIIAYASSKNVMIVSPTSFFAYLQTLLYALNTMQIETQVQEIIKYLNESSTYLKHFEENMNKVGKNISTLMNSYNRVSDDARKLSTRISKVTNNKSNLILVNKLETETLFSEESNTEEIELIDINKI